jgi:pimeloyl-ACP methyl ester carboxylesterase
MRAITTTHPGAGHKAAGKADAPTASACHPRQAHTRVGWPRSSDQGLDMTPRHTNTKTSSAAPKADRDLQVTTRDGVRLAVSDHGQRTARHTVVFLHGFCLTQQVWMRQTRYLLRRYGPNIRVISYDHRGHGRSDRAALNTYRIDQLADDLADVLTTLDIVGPLTLVGHSMGAMTALTYAARHAKDIPIDPHGLVLVATAAGRLADRGLGRLLDTPATAALVGLLNHTPTPVLTALAAPVCAALERWPGVAKPEHATLAALAADALATTPVSTILGFLAGLRNYDQYARLGEIRAHTVVLSGGVDLLTPASHSYDLAAGIAGARHIHVAHAGHMLTRDAPGVVNDAIRQLLSTTHSEAHIATIELGLVGSPRQAV